MDSKELLNQFNEKYGGYVCIDEQIVKKFMEYITNQKLHTPEYLYDWVLASDIAYEVVE